MRRDDWWQTPLFFLVGWFIPAALRITTWHTDVQLVGVAIACAWAGYRWSQRHAA
jgi:hypothetical protein